MDRKHALLHSKLKPSAPHTWGWTGEFRYLDGVVFSQPHTRGDGHYFGTEQQVND